MTPVVLLSDGYIANGSEPWKLPESADLPDFGVEFHTRTENFLPYLRDPQTLARGMVIEQDHPVLGKIKLPNLPFRFSDCDTTPRGPAPLLGQHNREVAAELGFSKTDIDDMVRDGVLYAEAGVKDL